MYIIIINGYNGKIDRQNSPNITIKIVFDYILSRMQWIDRAEKNKLPNFYLIPSHLWIVMNQLFLWIELQIKWSFIRES